MLALAVAAYAVDRAGDRSGGGRAGRSGRGNGDASAGTRSPGRDPGDLGLAAAAVALGALLFAGALAGGGHAAWPGLPAGAACAALGYVAVAAFFARARGRVEGPAATLLTAYAEALALALAAVAIFLPPVALAALAAFVVLAVRLRGDATRKFAGLRVLR